MQCQATFHAHSDGVNAVVCLPSSQGQGLIMTAGKDHQVSESVGLLNVDHRGLDHRRVFGFSQLVGCLVRVRSVGWSVGRLLLSYSIL